MHSINRPRPLTTVAVLAALCPLVTFAQIDPFADQITAYDPGTGFATDFATGLGFTNTASALGAPASVTPGDFGGPVSPFAPPYLSEQLLSIGAGGSVTVSFDPPIFNHPGNPFGIDFIVYGNTGFNITNGDFSGGGITDGSTFGENTGRTRLSVSADNQTYFELDPNLAPVADGALPTHGSGRFGHPADPSLTFTDFAGADLAQIEQLYQGSAGGTGYDLDWARSINGEPANLLEVRYVKIDVIEGKSEIDALSAVLPSQPIGPQFLETFAQDPATNGWRTTGEKTLFQWDTAQQRLNVVWDSTKPNSYFYLPLGQRLTIDQAFSLAFDITLNSIAIGSTPDKPFTFPIVIGLIDINQATREDYFRGSGIHAVHGPRGTVEWNYLPDSGFGATVSSGLISQDNQWAFQNTFPLELNPGVAYQVQLNYDPSTQTLHSTMTSDGVPFGPLNEAHLDEIFGNSLAGGFTQLGVDTLAIASYSDEGQSPPEFAGSIQARGSVDNLRFSYESNLSIDQIRLTNGQMNLSFQATEGWDYWLEQSHDFKTWLTLAHQYQTVSGKVAFAIEQTGTSHGFFRVRGGAR